MNQSLKSILLSFVLSSILAVVLFSVNVFAISPARSMQQASPAAVDLTPISGGASFGGATTIAPGIEYSVSTNHAPGIVDGYFTFDATPGQLVTIVLTSTTIWPSPNSYYLYDQAHVNPLVPLVTLSGPEQSVKLRYTGNSSTPTQYYLRCACNSGAHEYHFQLSIGEQTDGGMAADAGDTPATARVLTPAQGSVVRFEGITGRADTEDWYRFNVLPGQMISVTSRVLDYDGASGLLIVSLFGANTASSLQLVNFTSPSTDAQTVRYTNNNITQPVYYLRVQSSATNANALRYQFDVLLTPQSDASQNGDAGDDANSARVITPTLNSLTTYTGTMGRADVDDWFRINALSGQVISLTVRILNYDTNSGTAFATLYDQSGTTQLNIVLNFPAPDLNPQRTRYMSNNTTPSAYILKLKGLSNANASQYQIDVLSQQQKDANLPGDAGDDFDSARVITPGLDSRVNLLGSADENDFYKVDLPDVDPTNPSQPPYSLIVSPVPWPAGSSGSLDITLYNPNRSIRGSAQSIPAPTTDTLALDLTGCDGCYFEVNDNSSGTTQLEYTFQVLEPKFVYLPVVTK